MIKQLLRSKRNLIILALVAAAVSFGGWTHFTSGSKSPQYQISTIQKGTIVSSVSASGTIQTANFTPVTTRAGGTVAAVYVKDGDTVTAGQKIMDIALDRDGQAQNASAYASYLGAQANLNSAQAKVNSLQATLFKTNQAFINDKGINNPSDAQKSDPVYIQENATWLQAEADYKNQQTLIAQAQSALSSAWINYEQNSPSVTAPAAGTIDSVTFAPGMIITSVSSTSSSGSTTNTSQRVAVIKNDNLPVASVNVSEIDVYKIKTGQRVTITLDSIPGKSFTGKVVSVDRIGSTTSNVTNYPVIVQFDTGNVAILPHMAVIANIIVDTKSNVLIAPSAAIQTKPHPSLIFYPRHGEAPHKTIRPGVVFSV
jgi:HlyD family secretion protein